MAEIKKITKREMFDYIRNAMSNDTKVVDFCNHEIELLDKKASNSKSKVDEKGEEIKNLIIATLTDLARPATISDIQDNNQELKELSNQKISAYLKKLVDSEIITKTFDKRKAYFSI